jgi:uncharacterized protein (DUF952 family)
MTMNRSNQKRPLYKVLARQLWEAAEMAGQFAGAGIDLQDGFIHLSSTDQVVETVQKHFAGQDDLMLISIDEELLGESLRWEVSRGGALFPHVYGPIPLSAILQVQSLPMDENGGHRFPF